MSDVNSWVDLNPAFLYGLRASYLLEVVLMHPPLRPFPWLTYIDSVKAPFTNEAADLVLAHLQRLSNLAYFQEHATHR